MEKLWWWWKVDKNGFRGWGVAVWAGFWAWVAWPPHAAPFALAIAFAPLIRYVQRAPLRRAVMSGFVGMLLWNLLTTFWIRHATLPGALFAVIANALIFTVPWWGLAITRRIFRPRFRFLFFVITWLTWEYFHFRWELAWPWLTLGNAFATTPQWVQWYEYTGVLGGTLWIWWITYALIFLFDRPHGFIRRLGGIVLAIGLPIALSHYIGAAPVPAEGEKVVVGCIQPNIDPYREKFDARTNEGQLRTLLQLSQAAVDKGARIVIWPETAIPGVVDEQEPFGNPYVREIVGWLKEHPQVWLISGAVSRRVYRSGQPPTPTARPAGTGVYVDYFNAVMVAHREGIHGFYHKKKMVPGVESLPYPQVLGILRPLMADLGGITGAYGTDDHLEPLRLDSLIVAPAICYESVFGDFLRRFVLRGAALIAVVTNDGWWGTTDGHRQHFHYARLRAIETRRWVVRSANTGISGIIDPQGHVVRQLGYDRAGMVVAPVFLHQRLTYYARTGDFIGRLAGFLLIIFAALAFSKYYVYRVKNFPYIR